MYRNFFYFAAGYYVCKHVMPVAREVVNKQVSRLSEKKT